MVRTVRAFVVACSVIALTGCAGQPHPTLRELEQLPAARITYPGSVGLGQSGSDSNRTFGVNAAIDRVESLTDHTPAELLAYYQQELTAEGWSRDDAAGEVSEDVSQTWAWVLGGRIFELSIMAPAYEQRFRHRFPQYQNDRTLYEVLIR